MKLATATAVLGFLLGVYAWGRYVHETSKEDYVQVTVEGIEIGYRCRIKGRDLDQCRDDYRKFMGMP